MDVFNRAALCWFLAGMDAGIEAEDTAGGGPPHRDTWRSFVAGVSRSVVS